MSDREIICFLNAKELADQIKVSCPVLFENSAYEEFVEQLEKYVLIEKFYGNTKDTVMELVRNFLMET